MATIKCHNVVSQHPREECNYAFAAAYRSMEKLCLPTLGVPKAGKTHWLSMVYWELNRGNYPGSVEFEKAKSRTSEDFDILVEAILKSRIGTAATQRERIPRPWCSISTTTIGWPVQPAGEHLRLFGRGDARHGRGGLSPPRGPWRPTATSSSSIPLSPPSRRPKPSPIFAKTCGGEGVRTGPAVRTPVALCVTKIDLPANRPPCPAARRAAGSTRSWPASIPAAKSLTRGDQARSRLTARLREAIWPGWQIERQVRDLFGGRYCFSR